MKTLYGVGVAFVLTAMSAFADTDSLHARVSVGNGDALIKGSADQDWSYATSNTLVMPGDTVWVDKQGVLEIELPGASFLRLADQSKADVVALQPDIALRGWIGAYFIQRMSRSTGAFAFATPACTVEATKDSGVRIDVLQDGASTVSVFWGHASVNTDVGGKVFLRSGERTYVDVGMLPSGAVRFDRTRLDRFDEWSNGRARYLAEGEASLPQAVFAASPPIGAAELSKHGEWVFVDNEPCWRPSVAVSYVPYQYGHWSYVPAYGYVWVDEYPFAYVTSHYGRWRRHPHHGWIWSYRAGWAPAWVASVRCGSNFVWAPLDPFNRPALIAGAAAYSLGGVRFSVGAVSYCPADALLLYGPAPVRPCPVNLIAQVPAQNVYVWNIWVGSHRSHRDRDRDWDSASPPERVREYTPHRVVRGVDTTGPTSVRASERHAALERREGRRDFTPASRRVDARPAPTFVADSTHETRLRSVDLSPEAASVRSRADRHRLPEGEQLRMTRVDEPVGGGRRDAPVQREEAPAERRDRIRQREEPSRSMQPRTFSGSEQGESVRQNAVPSGRPGRTTTPAFPQQVESPMQDVAPRTDAGGAVTPRRMAPRDESLRTSPRTYETPRVSTEPQPEAPRFRVRENPVPSEPRIVDVPNRTRAPRVETPPMEAPRIDTSPRQGPERSMLRREGERPGRTASAPSPQPTVVSDAPTSFSGFPDANASRAPRQAMTPTAPAPSQPDMSVTPRRGAAHSETRGTNRSVSPATPPPSISGQPSERGAVRSSEPLASFRTVPGEVQGEGAEPGGYDRVRGGRGRR